MKDNLKLKTLGPRLAFLVAELYERQKTIFSNHDVEDIAGLSPNSARGLANRLVARGLATRLKPGLFILVPAELGHKLWLGNHLVDVHGRTMRNKMVLATNDLRSHNIRIAQVIPLVAEFGRHEDK